jgi:hypothetical protein
MIAVLSTTTLPSILTTGTCNKGLYLTCVHGVCKLLKANELTIHTSIWPTLHMPHWDVIRGADMIVSGW